MKIIEAPTMTEAEALAYGNIMIAPETIAAATMIDGGVLVDPVTGAVPDEGYAVPVDGRSILLYGTTPLTLPRMVARYIITNADALRAASAFLRTRHVGGVCTLDVVRLFDTPHAAWLAAVFTNQPSYTDVTTGAQVMTDEGNA